MKKTLVLLLALTSFVSFGQETLEDQIKRNEISSNLFDLVVAGSFNLTYERLFEGNQSLLVSATFFDTFAYYDVGFIEDNSAFSFKAAYLIYFSKSKDHAGFFFYPQLKIRSGEITIDEGGFFDGNGNFTPFEFSYDIDGFSAGFGLGHKWIFNNKFSLMVFGEIARDLGGNNNDEYIDNVEPRFGVNLGIRF